MPNDPDDAPVTPKIITAKIDMEVSAADLVQIKNALPELVEGEEDGYTTLRYDRRKGDRAEDTAP